VESELSSRIEPPPASPEAIAASFVRARLEARALAGFPGPVPVSLAAGYACQDAAIAQWPDYIAGWKIGYIPAERRDASGEDRVTGPIFSRAVWHPRAGAPLEFPVFTGGFAAVEAEYVFKLGADAPAGQRVWSPQQAATLVESLHIGVETAGSPLASINVLGPPVVVSDFGNNAGLILGAAIPDWEQQAPETLVCQTWIEDVCVGRGGASSIPGGLLGALAFALARCARRGLPMRAGMLVTTGAATGIHDIRAGQRASVRFGSWGEIRCCAVPAMARYAAGGPA
jgi:2-keto-4-pentenoate hydratase